MPSTFFYCAYGLIIQSPIPLPELVAGAGEPDVTIRFGKLEYQPVKANREASEMHVVGGDIYLSWDDIGTFLVRDGREIVIQPLPRVNNSVLRLFILGTTLAMLLCQRGLTVFHASAVTMGNGVLAFAGVKGAGKSTFAAALHAAGHDLVADDIVAIDASGGRSMVLPGFPHLKLWPDSIALLGADPQLMPRLRPELEKRSHSLRERFSRQILPLRYVCVINPGPALTLEMLQAREALAALMPYWYGARFGMEQLRTLGLSAFFRQCVGVVSCASVYRLQRPRSMPTLDEITELIAENLI